MTKNEVFRCIRRNGHNYYDAVTLLSDFLLISKNEAKEIWQQEFGEPPACRNHGRKNKNKQTQEEEYERALKELGGEEGGE